MANTTNAGAQEVQVERRNGDRRKSDQPVAVERRKKPRRRQIDPTTCERDYSDPEIEFMHALDDYKRRNGRMFPTCSEILEVIRELGYVQVREEHRADAAAEDASTAESTANASDSTGDIATSDTVSAESSESIATETATAEAGTADADTERSDA